uniref:Polyprotein n=1 Tax=Rhizoctonia solani fusarivirus 4 TaxID=2870617 RepID=A0A8K1HUG4_9VIRU|nr:RNA-dependent RNA polymerase [Rhizoctonia solani fusarivirus 4]UBR58462.1 polyprotein [Rhizoctonia solani fusarivirus 4]
MFWLILSTIQNFWMVLDHLTYYKSWIVRRFYRAGLSLALALALSLLINTYVEVFPIVVSVATFGLIKFGFSRQIPLIILDCFTLGLTNKHVSSGIEWVISNMERYVMNSDKFSPSTKTDMFNTLSWIREMSRSRRTQARILITTSMGFTVWISRRLVKFWVRLILTVVYTVVFAVLIYLFGEDLEHMAIFGWEKARTKLLGLKFLNDARMQTYRELQRGIIEYYEASPLLASLLLLKVLRGAIRLELLIQQKVFASKRFKYAKVLRNSSVAFAHFVDALRVPQMMRNVFKFEGEMTQEQHDVILAQALKDYDSMGYPVKQTKPDSPVMTEKVKDYEGKPGSWDNILVGGSNWRIHLPTIKTHVQTHFNFLKQDIIEYKYSLTFANHENQLESISRYFAAPEIDFPQSKEVFDAVWDITKSIFRDSRVMPLYVILKAWDKKYNMGVFSSSLAKTKFGTFRKMKRREWFNSVGGFKGALDAFKSMYENAFVTPNYAQFFTKLENLPPSKWLKDKVRTPIAGALPMYLAQMVVSGDANKKFRYEDTPIKLGMPLKGSVMAGLWERHARMKTHFAGDCTSFDSTIQTPIINLIKNIRLRGFENNRDLHTIEWMIDNIYDRIENAFMVSANTGDVYRKGGGLMTGHASTSTDNSLVMVALYLGAWVTLTGRSAEEFKHYNELSVYGDDHVLSMAEDVPPTWTWHNIVKTMKSWGVEMREEVPTDGLGTTLHNIPFLKKYCRTPTSLDLEEWKKAFGDLTGLPKYITYHDPQSLIGKAVARVTNKSPDYMAKRLQSFLYLTAHNYGGYAAIHRGLRNLLARNKDTNKRIGHLTPTYETVLQKWYTESMPIDLDDGKETEDIEDIDFRHEAGEAIVFYGEVTLIMTAANMISKIPDLITPVVRALRFESFLVQKLSPYLSWIPELIGKTNNCQSDGHLRACFQNSAYEFINDKVRATHKTNTATLLVRHWLFLAARMTRIWTTGRLLNGVQNKIANANFAFNGYVMPTIRSTWSPTPNILLCALLSFVEVPELPGMSYALNIRLPDLVGIVDDYTSALVNSFLSTLPTSFRDLVAPMSQGKSMLVEAATGSGKSTHMFYYVYTVLGSSRDKIILIVPRVTLAKGLYGFLCQTYDWDLGYITGEGVENPSAKNLIITSGSFLMRSSDFMLKNNVFIFDECHLAELDHILVRGQLNNTNEMVISASATPSDINKIMNKGPYIRLPVQSAYSYTRKTLERSEKTDIILDYANIITQTMKGHNYHSKSLVFVDSFKELTALEKLLTGNIGKITAEENTSETKDLRYVLATSAADVGVTVSDVDIVFTKAHRLSVARDGSVKQVALDESLLRQRCGRVGRTHYGHAYIVEYKQLEIEEPGVYVPLHDALDHLSRTGVSITALIGTMDIICFKGISKDWVSVFDDVMREYHKLCVRHPDIDLKQNINTVIFFLNKMRAAKLPKKPKVYPGFEYEQIGDLETARELLVLYLRTAFGEDVEDEVLRNPETTYGWKSSIDFDGPPSQWGSSTVCWWAYTGMHSFGKQMKELLEDEDQEYTELYGLLATAMPQAPPLELR